MTPAAQTAVSGADAVIGYSLYIQLIAANQLRLWKRYQLPERQRSTGD